MSEQSYQPQANTQGPGLVTPIKEMPQWLTLSKWLTIAMQPPNSLFAFWICQWIEPLIKAGFSFMIQSLPQRTNSGWAWWGTHLSPTSRVRGRKIFESSHLIWSTYKFQPSQGYIMRFCLKTDNKTNHLRILLVPGSSLKKCSWEYFSSKPWHTSWFLINISHNWLEEAFFKYDTRLLDTPLQKQLIMN